MFFNIFYGSMVLNIFWFILNIKKILSVWHSKIVLLVLNTINLYLQVFFEFGEINIYIIYSNIKPVSETINTKSFAATKEYKYFFVVVTIDLLRYDIRINKFYDYLCGDTAIIVIVKMKILARVIRKILAIVIVNVKRKQPVNIPGWSTFTIHYSLFKIHE